MASCGNVALFNIDMNNDNARIFITPYHQKIVTISAFQIGSLAYSKIGQKLNFAHAMFLYEIFLCTLI